MHNLSLLLRGSRPLDVRQADLLEQTAQVIARIGQHWTSPALPRPGDPYGFLNRRPSGYDPLLRMFRLVRAHELVPVIAAVDEPNPIRRIERCAVAIADTLALHDDVNTLTNAQQALRRRDERRSPGTLWQREVVSSLAEAFAAGDATLPSLRALSLLTLLDRSPHWFHQIGPAPRHVFVRWVVSNLVGFKFD